MSAGRGIAKLLLTAGVLTAGVLFGPLTAVSAIIIGLFVGLPILDSIPAFLHKERFKLADERARKKQDKQNLKIAKAKEDAKSKLNTRKYNKDYKVNRNEPTQENIYTSIDNLDMNKDKKEEPKKEVLETKNIEKSDVKPANQEKTDAKSDGKTNKQFNNYGTVINIDGNQTEFNNADLSKQISEIKTTLHTLDERISRNSQEAVANRQNEYNRISNEINADIQATLKQIRELNASSPSLTPAYKTSIDYSSIPNINGQNTNIGGIYVGNNQTVVRNAHRPMTNQVSKDAGRKM